MTEYLFDNANTDPAAARFKHLANLLDGATIDRLRHLKPPRRRHIMNIGAGANYLNDRLLRWSRAGTSHAGPRGVTVTAVDIDTSHLLPAADSVTVIEHDIRDSLPDTDTPPDIIVARLCLQWLPEREQILQRCVEALAPGGLLFLGEFTGPLDVIDADTDDDKAVFDRVTDAFTAALTHGGVDFDWPWRAGAAMTTAGLTDVATVEAQRAAGRPGDDWAGLHIANLDQIETELLRHGVAAADLKRCRAMITDPESKFSAMWWRFIMITGFKPH